MQKREHWCIVVAKSRDCIPRAIPVCAWPSSNDVNTMKMCDAREKYEIYEQQ